MGSSVFEVEIFWTAIVIDGRLSACATATRGRTNGAAAPASTERRERRLMLISV